MIYTAHQPDLLPYSGFWYKMATADVFDLKIWDQYVERGYQRRVKMRDHWVSLPLVKGSNVDPINLKRVQETAPKYLADQVHKWYRHHRKSAFWDERGPMVCDEIRSIKTDLLWEFNLQLILMVRSILGIETPIALTRPRAPGLRGSEGLIHVMRAFPGPMTYLSGTGARAYMGDCQEFEDAGVPVIWSRHKAVTGDSILSVLFDYEDPLSVVLAETDEDINEVTNEHQRQGASA